MNLYPMKLAPAVKEIIWGGDKLKASYHKSAPFDKLAESWELTVRPDGMNVIENGEYTGMTLGEYIEKAGNAVIGEGYDADRFPLLIKFIDARDRLSIQVHPSDDYALANENEFGKTEMWYIVEADEGAELVFGLSGDYTKEAFDKAIAEGTVETLLHRVKVHAGEVYFIPSGLVHAIGAGILICEIQQNSNVTYRVYDYNRPGKDGKPRELHVAKAREVIVNHSPADIEALRFSGKAARTPELLASCDKFTVHKYDIAGERSLTASADSFLSLTFTDGEGEIHYGDEKYAFVKGDTYFIPAGCGKITVASDNAVCIAAQR
ncbi:MAG: class I mannose-6-phosphate isomerase [Clostridia bacterium]|nr:class I mannose-6-phosphate isomerase [Clostridia bacterium]